ncbi:hypothetical protein CLPUN_46560 [Clostridium puniceum]|uniref:Uncharacterized protein n=1 Tax=Clostridium puniceum TaxID=29367 RepID=A0A1S8T506_9CLOT|nr:hypothetical protein CLPUN_46560 [Clostridium puniceum]
MKIHKILIIIIIFIVTITSINTIICNIPVYKQTSTIIPKDRL